MANARRITETLLNAGTNSSAFQAAFQAVSRMNVDARTLSRIAHDYAGSGVGKRNEFASREAALAAIRGTFTRASEHEAAVNQARRERIATRQAIATTRTGREAAPGLAAIRGAGPIRTGGGIMAAKLATTKSGSGGGRSG